MPDDDLAAARLAALDEGWPWRRFVGWVLVVLLLLAMLVPIAAFAFSVGVSGSSMRPTLGANDRLLIRFWERDDLERFDLVEARVGVAKTPVVKRVVGMPGDTVSVAFEEGEPVVTVRPEGSETTYVVVNPTWQDQVGDAVAPCCNDDGTAGTKPVEVVVPDDHYWLLGDNWGGSDDSRTYGFVDADDIGGDLGFRLLPLSEFGTVDNPAHLEARR